MAKSRCRLVCGSCGRRKLIEFRSGPFPDRLIEVRLVRISGSDGIRADAGESHVWDPRLGNGTSGDDRDGEIVWAINVSDPIRCPACRAVSEYPVRELREALDRFDRTGKCVTLPMVPVDVTDDV